MNLDKTIKELQNRLDEVHPYSASLSIINHQNGSDGINYWKGKKIISIKAWNELYQKSSTLTDTFKTTLTSRKPLQYFPNDYNGSITLKVIDELKEEAQKWNADYYEFLEYRKNPTLGRMKCRECLLSGSNDDPIFIGIEKVFARIVMKHCNNNSHNPITYHCNVMNIFSCPFESKEEIYNKSTDEKDEAPKYPYKREDLFALHQISFAIEQAITTFFEITKNNEIIYEVDFENDKVHEIHTKYNGESESWGWHENVNEQLSKVKPISNIIIRDEQDIYNILTNREKLETLIEEYENNHQLDREGARLEVCCDEKSPCVPNNVDDEKKISNNKRVVLSLTKTESLVEIKEKKQQQVPYEQNHSHRGENRHSKNIGQQSVKELAIEHLKPDLKSKIQEELEKSYREQLILLKQNKQTIIDFLIDNKDSIKVEDLKIYEPIYKCYHDKGNCFYCNTITNIICINCNTYNKVWLCANHWRHHEIEKHE